MMHGGESYMTYDEVIAPLAAEHMNIIKTFLQADGERLMWMDEKFVEFRRIFALYLDPEVRTRRMQLISWGLPLELTPHISFGGKQHQASTIISEELKNMLKLNTVATGLFNMIEGNK